MNKKVFKPILLGIFLVTIFLFSCNDHSMRIPQEYKVVSFKFKDIDQAKIDTIYGEYESYNYNNTTADTVMFPESLTRLSSSFFHMPDQPLPSNSNIDTLEVSVVMIDGKPQLHENSCIRKFVFGKKQEFSEITTPSIAYIPPYHNYQSKMRYIGFSVTLSYTAILENIYSGEQFELTGVWDGMQQVNIDSEGELTPLSPLK